MSATFSCIWTDIKLCVFRIIRIPSPEVLRTPKLVGSRNRRVLTFVVTLAHLDMRVLIIGETPISAVTGGLTAVERTRSPLFRFSVIKSGETGTHTPS